MRPLSLSSRKNCSVKVSFKHLLMMMPHLRHNHRSGGTICTEGIGVPHHTVQFQSDTHWVALSHSFLCLQLTVSAKDKETPFKSYGHIQRIYLNAALNVTECLLNWSSRNSAASVMERQVREAAWWDTKMTVFQSQGSLVWVAVLTHHVNISKLQSPQRQMRIKLCTLRRHLENETWLRP